ncbi:MAG: MBL fold metallo-hydrolase [Chloroflexi bacterium]|nr:MBL fold metallo-hydrolase [Chloroflexota bacterium]
MPQARLTIPLEPVDSLTVTTLVDNVFDVFMPDQGPARRVSPASSGRTQPSATMVGGLTQDQLIAEHGLSLLLTVIRGERSHTLLFDTGVSPSGMIDNMDRLQVDARAVEAVVCSHGHFDHTAGLDGLVRRLGTANLPVLIHPDFWNRRRVQLPGGTTREIPTTSRSALQGAGFDIIEDRQPSFLFDQSVLVTGEVERTTGYEPGFPVQEAWRNDHWEPDPLVLDDQAIIVNVRDRGVVIFTGCGHAGIVNIGRYALALTGESSVYGLFGGFHLNGPMFEPLIDRVCNDLSAMQPSLVVPAHCTGWRAQHALARAFGDAYVPDCVGTRFTL